MLLIVKNGASGQLNLMTKVCDVHEFQTISVDNLFQHRTRLHKFNTSPINLGIKVINKLSNEIKAAQSRNGFKRRLKVSSFKTYYKTLKELVNIPIFIMLRPRKGLDFVYSPNEVKAIKIDIQIFKENGADGFVFGALTVDGKVDEVICREIMSEISPLPATFHRAFDLCTDMIASLDTVISLGFQRILTSGGESTAKEGVHIIQKLVKIADKRIIIMPGSGVTVDNLAYILQSTGTTEFHGSAKVQRTIDKVRKGYCKMGASDEGTEFVSSSELVSEMVAVANKVGIVGIHTEK